jgi:hypothetical protein
MDSATAAPRSPVVAGVLISGFPGSLESGGHKIRLGGFDRNFVQVAPTRQRGKAMQSPYRVLDLTDEGALICGQILGDLGADVILVEPPGGVRARAIRPF